MKQLYVIYKENGKTTIKEVNIIKETEKQLNIECEGVNRKVVFVSALETFTDGYIFGYDREILIEKWNTHQYAVFGYLKKQLDEVKNLIVSEEYKNDLLA